MGGVSWMLVFLLVVGMGLGHHLRVVSPASLVEYFKEKYHAGNVPFSIANYGEVPYGKTISGEIGLPSVLEDCVLQQLPEISKNKPIILVQRNDCTFTQKSINVQKQGGSLAVIMDNNKNEDPGTIVMVDDGRGKQVHIPTILIGYEDGEKIVEAVKAGSAALSIEFQMIKKEKSDLTIWLDITQHKNFVFLRNLHPYYDKIKDHVNFNVAYPTRVCPSCLQTDCFYNGSYCRSDSMYYQVENKGQLIIREQLRQYFILQQSVHKWWMYVLEYDERCDDLATVEDCSIGIMRDVGIGIARIQDQVKKSFGVEDNTVLRRFSEEKYNSSIILYPSVIINSIIYRGNLESFQVYEVICQSLNTEPQGCSGYVAPQVNSLSTWVIFVIILTLLFGVFLMVWYRRIARRKLSHKINSQVNELVNQYITMYEQDRYNQMEEGRQGSA